MPPEPKPGPARAAVLFDLDGVLIDSPAAHATAWAEIFQPFGIELPPRRLHLDEGRKSLDIARRIADEYNLGLDDRRLLELIAKKRRIYRRHAPESMRDGVREVLEAVRDLDWLIGLVSGSAPENIFAVLTRDDVGLFDTVVTEADYDAGKPDPEPFLIACRRLGAEPHVSIAVENAILGVEAAKSAGMKVIALTSTLSRRDLKRADYIIDDIAELPSLIGRAPIGDGP